MTRHLRTVAAALMLLSALLAGHSAAAEDRTIVVMANQDSVAEAALASCAGGALIGVAVGVLSATGPVTAGPVGATAGLFCGLSVAASLVSTFSIWTWRTATSLFR